MRYPPGTVRPSVMESPNGITRTPPFDSAPAGSVVTVIAANTATRRATVRYISRRTRGANVLEWFIGVLLSNCCPARKSRELAGGAPAIGFEDGAAGRFSGKN